LTIGIRCCYWKIWVARSENGIDAGSYYRQINIRSRFNGGCHHVEIFGPRYMVSSTWPIQETASSRY